MKILIALVMVSSVFSGSYDVRAMALGDDQEEISLVPFDWLLVGESTDGETFYLNRSSVREIGTNRVAMTMTSYLIADEDGARSNVSLHEFDCIGKRWRTEKIELFEDPLGKGERLMKFDKKIEWDTIPSKTIAAEVLKTVCSR